MSLINHTRHTCLYILLVAHMLLLEQSPGLLLCSKQIYLYIYKLGSNWKIFKSQLFEPSGKRNLFVGMYSVVPKSTTINNAAFNDDDGDVGDGNEKEDDDDYDDNEDDAVFAVRQHQFV